MQRHRRLERKFGLRADPDKTREWERRSRRYLPRESLRRRRLNQERRQFVYMVIKHRSLCEARLIGCTLYATEVNELQRGPAREDCWLEWDKVTSLCRHCHRVITENPDWAYRHGHQVRHEGFADFEWAAWARKALPCGLHCTVDHRAFPAAVGGVT
jgi:hypothetical protein